MTIEGVDAVDTLHTFPLITVSGGAYEMGYQHGAQAKFLIERYMLLIERITQLSRDALCRNAMTYLPRVKALSPPLVEEVRGLAEPMLKNSYGQYLVQVLQEDPGS